jgi:hypothetical protein
MRDFSPIYTTEQVVLSFDFSLALATGETLSSPVVSIVVVSGIDTTPVSRLIGSPSISGSVVMQMIGTTQAGAIYDVIATVGTNAGQTLTTNAHLASLNVG